MSTRYFKRAIEAIVDSSFYSTYIVLPNQDTALSLIIHSNPKFYPFLEDCIGVIDCTHVPAAVPAEAASRYRDRSGNLTHNHLAACSFDMLFLYILGGWEGSVGDGRVFLDARQSNFSIPQDKYYLADGGFASCNTLLVPYCNVRYHLKEFLRGRDR